MLTIGEETLYKSIAPWYSRVCDLEINAEKLTSSKNFLIIICIILLVVLIISIITNIYLYFKKIK